MFLIGMEPPESRRATFIMHLLIVVAGTTVLLLGRKTAFGRIVLVAGSSAFILGMVMEYGEHPKSSFTPLIVFGLGLILAALFLKKAPAKEGTLPESSAGVWDRELDR